MGVHLACLLATGRLLYCNCEPFAEIANTAIRTFNKRFQRHSPLTIAAATTITLFVLVKLRSFYQRTSLSQLTLRIPSIRRRYETEMAERFTAFQQTILQQWAPLGPATVAIPNQGKSQTELVTIAQRFATATSEGSPESNISSFLEYQIVLMIAGCFGGKSDEVMGTITSEGSLMAAVKGYRDWGRMNGGRNTILAPDTIHPDVLKAALVYDMEVRLIPTNEKGEINLTLFTDAIDEYSEELAVIFVSAFDYSTGNIDPVRSIGQSAYEYEVPVHVDISLGSFLLPFHVEVRFLALRGITSISVDLHDGLAPIESSALIAKKISYGHNLIFYCLHPIPDWRRNIPKISQNAVLLRTFLGMLTMGKTGYQALANAVHSKTISFANVIKKFPEQLQLLGEPYFNVVVFKVDSALGFNVDVADRFAYQMSCRGFPLYTLKGVHYCATDSLNGTNILERFEQACSQSLHSISSIQQQPTSHSYRPEETSLAQRFVERLLRLKKTYDLTRLFFMAMHNPTHKYIRLDDDY